MIAETKTLIIIRGVPGSGKSTLARILVPEEQIFEADKFWYDKDGNYNFDTSRLHQAHIWCQSQLETVMQGDYPDFWDGKLVVSNTTTTEKEIQPYLDLANKYGFRIISLIVENRHGSKSIHGLPIEILDKMEIILRNNIKLK